MSATTLFGTSPAPQPSSASTTASASASISTQGTNTIKHAPSVEIPSFDELFPYISIYSSTRGYLTRLASLSDVPSAGASDSLIGQQFVSYISMGANDSKESKADSVLHCNPLLDLPSSNQKVFAPADKTFRDKLRSNPYIMLRGKLTGMTPQIMDEIFALADDLQISEVSAISLYGEASDLRTRKWLESKLSHSFFQSASAPFETHYNRTASKTKKAKKHKYDTAKNTPVKFGNDVPAAARELFFHERSCLLSTLLILIKERIAAIDNLLQYDQDSHNVLPPSQAVIVATDELLQKKLIPNLINCVKSLTKFSYDKIYSINSSKKTYTSSMNATGSILYAQSSTLYNESMRKEKSDVVLMSFALSQRQRAVECLFYLLYQTQVLGAELTSMVDLVKELSNRDELRVLDPLKDVPSLQEEHHDGQQQQQIRQQFTWDTSNNISRGRDLTQTFHEKNPAEWENELIEDLWNQGKPQLMHCVSVLSLSIMCALDSSQFLFDRFTHGTNKFGQGNALLPPANEGQPPSNFLDKVYSLLDINSTGSQWNRKDIWGLLCGAYALLLQSHVNISNTANDLYMSPGVRGHYEPSPSTDFDVKAIFHSCLEHATNSKAFTFARKCIIPSIFSSASTSLHQTNHETDGTNFEFYFRVLAEFTNSYLETIAKFGEMPISREKWLIEAEEELHMQRLHHEQRMQFGIAPNKISENDTIGKIDFTKRPDCMDDLIAMVVEICSTCTKCSIQFWSREESEERDNEPVCLHPSLTLMKMESLQKEDNSLLPAYLSLLSVLSLAGTGDSYEVNVNGAELVNSILSQNNYNSSITWSYLLNALQWFADELSIQARSKTGTISSAYNNNNMNTSNTINDSSSYYYGANEEDNIENDPKSFSYNASTQQPKSTISNTDENTASSSLGENNTLAILSMLALISRVTIVCPNARISINSLQIPTSTEEMKQNDAITILFRLLTSSLSSNIKGEVFNVLAMLVKDDKEKASKAWELLEISQVLPTVLLSQYTYRSQGINKLPIPVNSVKFPPTGLPVNNLDLFAISEEYGILYEMEQVESLTGSYVATEGFLFFLHSLISCVGINSNLGASFRRPGISPYIEYIVFFIVPRIFKLNEMNSPFFAKISKCRHLYFASPADRYRLITRILEVVALILSIYMVPPKSDESFSSQDSALLESFQRYHQIMNKAAENLGLKLDGDYIFDASNKQNLNFEDLQTYVRDFREESVTVNAPSTSLHQNNSNGALLVPRPKSPGFSILSDILGGGHLLKSLLVTLVECNGALGIYGSAEEIKARAQSFSLFLDTPPSFVRFQNKMNIKAPLAPCFSLIPPALYVLAQRSSKSSVQFYSLDDPILWREQSIALSLRILCSVAAREDHFSRLVNSSSAPLTIVPVLNFGNTRRSPLQQSGLQSYTVSISRLSSILVAAAGSPPFNSMVNAEPLPLIVQYVGYNSQDDEIAKRAVGIVSFFLNNTSSKIGVPALCGKFPGGSERLAQSFSQKLLMPVNSSSLAGDLSIPSGNEDLRLKRDSVRGDILNLILSNLSQTQPNFSQILLGMGPSVTQKSSWNDSGSLNCLDAILHLLSHESFLLNAESASLAARSYHLIYSLLSSELGSDSSNAAFGKLRKENFCILQCKQYFTKTDRSESSLSPFEIVCNVSGEVVNERERQRNYEAMHAFAWLLKCVALELNALRDIPQPSKCKELLDLLLGTPDAESVLQIILTRLPLEFPKDFTGTEHPPPREILKAAKCALGPYGVFNKYEAIDLKLLGTLMQADTEENKASAIKWGQNWNNHISSVCSTSHVASAWELLIHTIAISSTSFVAKGHMDAPRQVLNHGQIIQITLSILRRVDLNSSFLAHSNHNLLMDGSDSHDNSIQPDFEIESSCALSLCMATIPLMHLLFDLKSYETEIENIVADIGTLSVVLASCISSCADAGPTHDERAVLLSSALTAALHWMELHTPKDNSFSFKNQNWREPFVNAAIHLSRLSANIIKEQKNPDVNKSNSIALSAREGFSSVIRFFGVSLDSTSLSWKDQNNNSMSSFLLRVFEGNDGANRLSNLVVLSKSSDKDISWMLLSIAQCRYGVEILMQAGLPAALLSAENTNNNTNYISSMERESYGTEEMNPPKHLYGHVILLSTMISVQDGNERIVAEAAKFIKHYYPTIQRVLRDYPRNADLTENIFSLLSLVTSKLQVSTPFASQSITQNENTLERIFSKDILLIERRVEDFVQHISSHPLPTQFLAPLPTKLTDLEHSRLETMQQSVRSSKFSWWDRLPEMDHNLAIRLPDPLSTSHFSLSGSTLFNTSFGTNGNPWTDEKYQHSISAGSSLIDALSFLKNRIMYSSKITISLDSILFVKGLYRCADTANVIHKHLVSSPTPAEATVPANQAQHVKLVEFDALSTLGPILGECAQMMLIISLLYLRSLHAQMKSSNGKSSNLTKKIINDFAVALQLILDELNIDQTGIGCIQDQVACKRIVRSLRGQIENIK